MDYELCRELAEAMGAPADEDLRMSEGDYMHDSSLAGLAGMAEGIEGV